jgi:ankyrin repeat protein
MGDFDSLKTALNRGVPVDTRDRYFKTPLMTASATGHLAMVKYLVEKG